MKHSQNKLNNPPLNPVSPDMEMTVHAPGPVYEEVDLSKEIINIRFSDNIAYDTT